MWVDQLITGFIGLNDTPTEMRQKFGLSSGGKNHSEHHNSTNGNSFSRFRKAWDELNGNNRKKWYMAQLYRLCIVLQFGKNKFKMEKFVFGAYGKSDSFWIEPNVLKVITYHKLLNPSTEHKPIQRHSCIYDLALREKWFVVVFFSYTKWRNMICHYELNNNYDR